MIKNLFFTSACHRYEFFAPLYIYFTLKHNENSHVQIALENSEKYKSENGKLIGYLQYLFGDSFSFIDGEFNDEKWLPNSVRFITTPTVRADYVYIGDIDILIMENNICEMHVAEMAKYKQKFSNKLRLNSDVPRLTGLHFSEFDFHYPIEIDETWLPLNDEVLLAHLIKGKVGEISKEYQFRPVHGIHISPRRNPIGKLGWDIEKYSNEFKRIAQSQDFMVLRNMLNIKARNYLNVIENVVDNNFDNYKIWFDSITSKIE